MSDTAVSETARSGRGRAGLSATLRVLRRTPFTTSFVLAMLIVGVATGSLWAAAADQPWFHDVATGLPALTEGRWWTVFTAMFFAGHPWVYVTLAPLVIGGTGWAEWKFGSLRTAGLFVAGHLVGVLGAAALLAAAAQTDSLWATHLATVYDVGPSCGALTALVFAIATLPSPWRLRARIAVFLWVTISVFYLGMIHDLEHAIAMAIALAVSGFLPAFRRRSGRPSQREWRLIAFTGIIAIGVIQILNLVVPYDGPLGRNQPVASFVDVAIDVAVIALIANGLRLGHKLGWVVALILGFYNVVTGVLATLALPLMLQYELIDAPIDIVGLAFAPSVLWAAMLAVLFVGRGSFRVRLRRAHRTLAAEALSREELVARLERFGGGTISWMTTWNLNERIAAGAVATAGPTAVGTTGAAASGALAYQSHSGVAIMLGDPIVAAHETADALQEFAQVTEQAGLVPCAFSVSADVASARPSGWRSVIVAEDTIVDLPGLEFKGKPWGDVRTAINRATREGIEFRMVTLTDEPWSTLAQVRAISEQWTGDKGLPEMRFTLGTVDEALDPRVLVGIAVDADGSLHGITSWLPVYGPQDPATGEPRVVGWTLDLMRRRDGGFGPVMEFLIASSAQHFAQQGYEFVSLSGAPLVRPADAETGPVDQVLAQVGELIEPLYGFKSLHRFKQKFNPRHESLHLLFRDEGDLPRIGIALTRAYLPDATLRDLVASAAAKPEGPAKPESQAKPGSTGARA
ncbi:bifunctional lysylphosphatidylglycerol flippase/synthetase MprF [Leucobacter sp. HY1910]